MACFMEGVSVAECGGEAARVGGEGEAAGTVGDASHRVPTGDVLCTVKGCSGRPKQSTIFHCHRFKAEEEKDTGEQQKKH